jgi:Xaa-Pro aminopeptidase
MRWLIITLTLTLAFANAADLPVSEFKTRRAELMRRLSDGIVLLHAKADFASQDHWYQHAQHQDPSFYYFSGEVALPSSILAVDGTSQETYLFVPDKLSGYAALLTWPTRAATAARLGIEHAAAWQEFVPWLDRRLASNPAPILYVDDTESWWSLRLYGRAIPESNPPQLDPIEDPKMLWRRSLERRWPTAVIKSASPVIQDLRIVKSSAEIEFMRAAARASTQAWFRGAAAIARGESPRQVEAEVIRGCIDGGAQGPSFWPVVTPDSDFAYYHRFPAGKLVELDIGCDMDRYHTDLKRMVPVSSRFTDGQKEAWELFVTAYRAGLAVIREGTRRSDVFEAAIREIDRRKSSAKTSMGRETISTLQDAAKTRVWLLHSMGLQCCEGEPEILHAGMILAFEPSINIDGQKISIEDVTLVTRNGYEVLTPLPYDAADIERAMRLQAR